MTALSNILPSDVRMLKRRVGPSVLLVDALVARAAGLDGELRDGWQRFATTWRDYAAHEDWEWPPIPPSRLAYERGEELERELRSWKSILSSHCPGVPAPATRRPAPLFGTWATPADVDEQKGKTDAGIRQLDAAVGRCPTIDGAFRTAWTELVRSWVAFTNESASWLHGAAQFECSAAYEDDLAEWREAFGFACAGDAGTSHGRVVAQASAATTASPGGRGMGLAVGVCGLVIVLALAKGVRS